MPQQKKTYKIPAGYSPNVREEIVVEIIRYLQERTRKGKGAGYNKYNGSNANKYTKKYSKLKHKRKVNLTDTSEMLSTLGEYAKHRNGSVTIGYNKGSKLEGKVEGNRTGSYGRSPNASKARDFLAEADNEIFNWIADQFPQEEDVDGA